MPRIPRWPVVAVITVVGLATVLLAGPASAAGPVRCEVVPFDLTVDAAVVLPGPGGVRAAWRAHGSTTCGETLISLDVWEHALVGSQQDDILIHGQILIDFTGAGVHAELEGRLRGTAACDASARACQVVAEVRAQGAGGLRLRLEQSLTLDLATRSISDLEVRQGVLIGLLIP